MCHLQEVPPFIGLLAENSDRLATRRQFLSALELKHFSNQRE